MKFGKGKSSSEGSSFVDEYLAESDHGSYGYDSSHYDSVHSGQSKLSKNKASKASKGFNIDDYLNDPESKEVEEDTPPPALLSNRSAPKSSMRWCLIILTVMGAILGVTAFLNSGDDVVVVNDDDLFYVKELASSKATLAQTAHSKEKKPEDPDEHPNDLSLAHNHAKEEDLGSASYHYGNLADINTDPYDDLMDTPIFFHIPRSGGTTLEHILGQCLGLIQASQVGAAVDNHAHAADTELQVLATFNNEYLYVNVDTTSVEGLHHAKALGLAESQMADVVYTEYIYDASSILFSEHHRGRLFTLFRHPVDRSVSMYYYLRSATWESTYDHTLQTYTLEDYAHKAQTEHNWMTRMLSNAGDGQLFPKHLDIAKQVLKNKALIGLLEEFDESIERFEQYFGWDELLLQSAAGEIDSPILKKHAECQARLISDKVNGHNHPPLDPKSDIWVELHRRNWFDMELYNFAVELFKNQSKWFDF